MSTDDVSDVRKLRVPARHGQDIADMVTVAEMDVAALREASRAAPAMRLVELEPQDAVAAVATGEVDLAIVHSYSNLPELRSPALTATHLVTEDVLLAVPATGGPPDTAGPVDLAGYSHHD